MTREDMLSEISSELVSEAFDMAMDDQYEDLHAWLQPLFIKALNEDYPTDAELEAYYNNIIVPELDEEGE